MGTEGKLKITIRLPADLVKRAKHFTIERHVDLQDVVAEALQRYLAQKGGR